MLSRRNVRIKVMQVLYSLDRDASLSVDSALLQLKKSFIASYELYLFTLFCFVRIAEYSKEDGIKKGAKLLPSEEDKYFTAKLCENNLLSTLIQNESLQKLFTAYKFKQKVEDDTIRHLYKAFADTEEYKTYLKSTSTDEDHLEMLLLLLKTCIQNESFNELIEDHYLSWIDDKSLVLGAIKKTVKALPIEEGFQESYRPSPEATVEFGEVLFSTVCAQDNELIEMIEPTLKNWDMDRLAALDIILLKMALVEFMHFSSIPTKVTLNEFVEISKLYSTPKSKDFINGILDRLSKKLLKEGKINKKGRGLIE